MNDGKLKKCRGSATAFQKKRERTEKVAHIQIHSIGEPMDAVLEDFCLESPGQKFILTGLNCMPEFAKDGFWKVKNKYGKTKGIMCWYGEIFYETQDRPLTEYHRISIEFADSVWGRYYQVLVRTENMTMKSSLACWSTQSVFRMAINWITMRKTGTICSTD